MQETKQCFKCKQELSVNEFYKNKGLSDGYLGKCKTCAKKDSSLREKKMRQNPEWVEEEKKRGREKYYRLGYKGLYKPSPKRKKEILRKYLQKYPEKALATRFTGIFLDKKNKDTHFHHWSYNEKDWLDIIELHYKDHAFIHRYMIYDPERMMYRTLEGVLLDSKEKHIDYFNKCKNKFSE